MDDSTWTADVIRATFAGTRTADGRGFTVVLWDGTRAVEPDTADNAFTLHVRTPSVLRALLSNPDSSALGEAYVHGDLDLEGDLMAAVEVAARVRPATLGLWQRIALLPKLWRLPAPDWQRDHRTGVPKSAEREKQSIRYHYDHPEPMNAPPPSGCGYPLVDDRISPGDVTGAGFGAGFVDGRDGKRPHGRIRQVSKNFPFVIREYIACSTWWSHSTGRPRGTTGDATCMTGSSAWPVPSSPSHDEETGSACDWDICVSDRSSQKRIRCQGQSGW